MVQEAARRLAGRGVVVQINTEDNPHLAGRFGIRGIPALHLLKNGKSVASLSGARPLDRILSWFAEYAR